MLIIKFSSPDFVNCPSYVRAHPRPFPTPFQRDCSQGKRVAGVAVPELSGLSVRGKVS